MNENLYDVIILGSGPAGLTAAIYTTRANLKTLIIAGHKWGGQLMLTTLVENFPGFPEGIQGPDLMANMRKQAEHHGAEVIEENFTEGDFTRLPSPEGEADGGQGKKPFTVTTEGGKTFQARSVIIATGADTKWLGVPGEQEKIGRGVSSCAPCDAPFFKNKRVIVVGGGDSAMEEALVMTRFASEVIMVHRKQTFRASHIMQDKVKNHPQIHIIYNAAVLEVLGEQKVTGVKLQVTPSDKTLLAKSIEELQKVLPAMLNGKVLEKNEASIIEEIPTDGVFVAIGHIPNVNPFKGIDLEANGFIKVHDHFLTNVEGVFVAGDVHDAQYKQAITAAGFGCAAALEAERWLMEQKAVT